MTFNNLGLSDTLLRAVHDSGYTTPTSIQVQAIPAILSGKDVMAAAQTGTGKTAGFTLPLLQLLSGHPPAKNHHPKALILTPTRELAAQVQESISTYGRHERLRSGVVFGGVNINPQIKMFRRGVEVLVATPGRLLDLHQQNAVRFSDIEILILDEADRMLDMGFIHDIKRVIALLPKKRQNLMFSATFSPDIRVLAKTICRDPIEIDVAPRNSTVEAITQNLYMVEKPNKAELLIQLLSANSEQTLVFSRTKHGADNLVKRLKREGISAEAIHGNKSQPQRTRVLGDFKNNRVQVLVATDIAARGIDIDQLATVINFDMPHVPEDYVHRIGRTGRAGATGQAISLVSSDERKQLKDIERLIKQSIKQLSCESFKFSKKAPAPANVNNQGNQDRNGARHKQGDQERNRRNFSTRKPAATAAKHPKPRSPAVGERINRAAHKESHKEVNGNGNRKVNEKVSGNAWATLKSRFASFG